MFFAHFVVEIDEKSSHN